MTKKSFLLYTDYYEHIQLLNNEEKGVLFDAIFSIALGKEVSTNLPAMVKMALSFIKSQLERDSTKYDEFIDKQRKNGKKGGRPKGKPKPLNDNPNNPNLNSKTPKSLNDTVTVTDTVNDITKKDIKEKKELSYEDTPINFKKYLEGSGEEFQEDKFNKWREYSYHECGVSKERVDDAMELFEEYYTTGKGKSTKSKPRNWFLRWKNWGVNKDGRERLSKQTSRGKRDSAAEAYNSIVARRYGGCS